MAGKKRKAGKFEADLEQTYHQVSGRKKKKKPARKTFSAILIALVIVAFVAAIGGGVYLYFFSGVTPGLILNNVTVLDIAIGGMSRDEATKHLSNAFQSGYCSDSMTVTIADQSIEISSSAAGLSLDVEKAVEDAYKLGRDGTQAQRKKEQMQSMAGKLELDSKKYLRIDSSAVQAQIDQLCDRFDAQAIDTTWELIGEIPELNTDEIPEVELALVIQAGTPGYEIDREALLEKVLQAYHDCEFSVRFDAKLIEPAQVDLDAVHAEVCVEPVEALMDQETFEVSDHAYGYTFDLEAAKALQNGLAYGESTQLALTFTAPENTRASLESLLFRDVLGTYTATASSDPYGRDVNLKLACEKLNGIVLMPGDVFSYNPALGERTAANGWKPADSYEGGATVQTYGGGICQPSSCLYMCALVADLEIVTRTNHSYISSYMPFGMDATVSWGGPEFRFRNSTDFPLRIEASSNRGSVTISLIGTDTKDYYVVMSYEVLSGDRYETVYQEMPADNEEGYKDGDVIVSGYNGFTVQTYKNKYSKETDELISTEPEAKSIYKRRDRVICKIIQEEVSDPSEESTEPVTENIE